MIDLVNYYPDELRKFKKNPSKLEEYNIFYHGPTELTHNEKIIKKSVEVDRIVPCFAHYRGKKWRLLERGTKEYKYGDDQKKCATSKEVQEKLKDYTSKCSPIIWGPGYFGASEILTLLNAKKMNPEFNLNKAVVIEGSEENAINFSVNLATAIKKYSGLGRYPERIDTYVRLYEESPMFLPEARSRLDYPHAAHIVFGAINDLVNIIKPNDSKILYILSKVAKMTDIILRSTQEFERLTDYEKKGLIKKMYDNQQVWDWLTEIPEEMGIKTEGEGIIRDWDFDDNLMAGVHSILYPNEKTLILACSEKGTYEFEKERVERSGLEEKFHFKDGKSSAAVWGLRVMEDLNLTSEGIRELEYSLEERIAKEPSKYNLFEKEVWNGGKLEISDFENLLEDELVDLRGDKRIEKSGKGLPNNHKKIRTIHENLSIVRTLSSIKGYSLGNSMIVETNLTTGLEDSVGLVRRFMESTSRKEVYESRKIPNIKGSGRIVIAEDDEDTGSVIKNMLEIVGFKAEHVKSGEEAIDLYKKGGIEGMVLDVELPNMTGIQVGNQIREGGDNCTPIIIMTGHGIDDYAFQAGRIENAYFLAKRFDNEELIAVLARLVNESKKRKLEQT